MGCTCHTWWLSRSEENYLRDACQNGDTNTTTTLPNVGIFTALGAGGRWLVCARGSESLCLSRPPRFVGGQSQKWGQLSSPPGVGGGWRFVDTLGSVSSRSAPDRFFAFSRHIPQASLGLTSFPSSPEKTPSRNVRAEQERSLSFQLS